MNRDELRKNINTHPLLDLPAKDRLSAANNALRFSLIDLLMKYLRFSDKLERRFSPEKVENESAIALEEDELNASRGKSTQRGRRFDGLAFTEAVTKAIDRYDASQGASFLTWFSHIYDQQLTEADRSLRAIKNQAIELPRLKGFNLETYRKFMDLLERMGVQPDRVSDVFISHAAREIGIDSNALRQILRIRCTQYTITLSATGEPPSEEDEENAINPADKSSDTQFNGVENAMLLGTVLDLLADYDEQEYPRLFFNNIFLSPLKDEDASDPEGQLRILLAREDALWQHVFIRTYLDFTLAEPPKPDSVAHIAACRALYPFNNKTIALYKKCSAANVSQQYAKFKVLQKKIKMTVNIIR